MKILWRTMNVSQWAPLDLRWQCADKVVAAQTSQAAGNTPHTTSQGDSDNSCGRPRLIEANHLPTMRKTIWAFFNVILRIYWYWPGQLDNIANNNGSEFTFNCKQINFCWFWLSQTPQNLTIHVLVFVMSAIEAQEGAMPISESFKRNTLTKP